MAWSSFESITSVNLDPKQGSCRIPIGFLPAHTDGDTFHWTQPGQIGMQPCLAPFSIVQHQRHCWSSSRERLTIPLITLHCIEYESSWKWFYSPYPIIFYFPKPLATKSDFHAGWGTWLIQVALQITWVALRIMQTCMHPILSPPTQRESLYSVQRLIVILLYIPLFQSIFWKSKIEKTHSCHSRTLHSMHCMLFSEMNFNS